METPLITLTVNIVPRFYLQQGWPIVPCERSRIPSCRQKKRLLTQATPIIAQNRELGFPAATVSDLKTSLLTTKFFEDSPATSLREVLLQGGLNQGTWKINQSQRYPQVFCKRKFKYSTMQPLKTLKPFELTWPLRKQPSNLRMLSVCLQKNLKIFCFDWITFFQVPEFK